MPQAVLVLRKGTQFTLKLKCGHSVMVTQVLGERPRTGQVWCCPRCNPNDAGKPVHLRLVTR